MITFGPVPSRRLGRSLGINNVPAKCCSYSCVYCQIGRTTRRCIERQKFFDPEHIVREVERHLEKLQGLGEPVDYLTFVPNGEPTLDMHLGRAIHALVPLGISIAVITNASLLGREDVRADLAEAHWVSLKMDTVRESVWRKLNRPHPTLKLSSVMAGLLQFAKSFRGDLVTETMLVSGINDEAAELRELSEVMSQINPRCCYVSIPTRPPAEPWVGSPTAEVLSECCALLAAGHRAVKCLASEDEEPFTLTGDVVQDILSITAVHPMEKKAVEEFLRKAGADWTVIERLLEDGRIIRTEFAGKRFFRKVSAEGVWSGRSEETLNSSCIGESKED